MAEHDTKVETELSKEVLAPPQGIREDLIATAVKFLQNPKVTQSPLSQKRAFLQRKGLTDEEVEEAIKRAGAVDSVPAQASGTQYTSQPGYPGQTLAMAPVIPQKIPEPVYSRWMRARDIIAVISVATGMSYAALRLYKELIRPLLFGIPSTDQRLDALEKNMSESMEKINQSLAGIEQVLGKQQEKLQNISHDVNSKASNLGTVQKDTSVGELKSELVSLKGLLLNRRQFPAAPASVPSLPAWQLTNETGDNSEAGDNSNSKGEKVDITGRQSPEISLSPSPSPLTASGAAPATDTQMIEPSKAGSQSQQDETGLTNFSADNRIPKLDRTEDLQEGDTLEVKGLVDGDDSVKKLPKRTVNTNAEDDGNDTEGSESLD